MFERLAKAIPEAKIALHYRNPLELLVAVILSAQCTDQRVNQVTPALFRRYPNVAALANADLSELEGLVKTCGLFRSKARNLKACARALLADFGGQVPSRREDLARLAGVGKKTAGVVSIHLGGEPAFPVDTHIQRLSKRLGFSAERDPNKVERDLCAIVPAEWWVRGHQLLIWHGRRTCTARSPACDECVVNALCPKLGVARPRPARRARP